MNIPATPRITLRRINNALTVLVILLAFYIILAPFLPRLRHGANSPVNAHAIVSYTKPAVIPSQPLIKIPRLNMNEAVHTGSSLSELNKGVWLIPRTSSPDKEGNTVMAGHRFTYAGPAVFYFLDKVRLDDKIYIDWQGKEYEYEVRQIRVVPPTAVEVQASSSTPKLTIYTCTPLLTAKNRLVVISDLIGVSP